MESRIQMRKAFLLLAVFMVGTILGAIGMVYYENHRNDDGTPMAQPDEPIYQLEEKVWRNGDTNAYYQLSLAIMDGGHCAKSLFWPLYMANAYNFHKAYYDVYLFLQDDYSSRYGYDSALYKMDSMTRRLALRYLKLGAEKNDSPCIQIIQELKAEHYPIKWFAE